MKLFFFSNPS